MTTMRLILRLECSGLVPNPNSTDSCHDDDDDDDVLRSVNLPEAYPVVAKHKNRRQQGTAVVHPF